jgi:hypothetical protein
MAKMIPIVLILLALSFSGKNKFLIRKKPYPYFSFQATDAASSCYACSDCGSTWDITKANIVQTSSSNDYCRVSINSIEFNEEFSFSKCRKQ